MLENVFVTIYRPSRTAMQSGNFKSKFWHIKFPCDDTVFNYDLMNWSGSKNTKKQLNLRFSTKEQAIDFAVRQNWHYEVIEDTRPIIREKSYAENFID